MRRAKLHCRTLQQRRHKSLLLLRRQRHHRIPMRKCRNVPALFVRRDVHRHKQDAPQRVPVCCCRRQRQVPPMNRIKPPAENANIHAVSFRGVPIVSSLTAAIASLCSLPAVLHSRYLLKSPAEIRLSTTLFTSSPSSTAHTV